jgi:hypothetical protein
MTDFLGNHTIDDVTDLLKNYDSWISTLQANYEKVKGAWASKDASAARDFQNDLEAMVSRYDSARSDALTSVMNPLASTENKYNAIVRAIHQGGEGTPPQKGDYSDLVRRLSNEASLLGQTLTPNAATLQPTATDWDLLAFKKSAGLDPVASLAGLQRSPFNPNAPALIPTWVKVAGAIGLGLWGLSSIATISKAVPRSG